MNISPTFDKQSNSSREESNSSGYVSEGSNEAKHELIKTSEISVKIDDENKENTENNKVDELKDENKRNESEDKLKVETEEMKKIKQSPVPKPPRLGAVNTARLDPQAYINYEINPSDYKTTKNTTDKKEESIQDTKENITENKEETSKKEHIKNAQENEKTNQVKTRSLENAHKDENTNDKRTISTLPKLQSTDKRKAPEPPGGVTNTSQAPEKSSKKGECNFKFLIKEVG